MIYFVSDIHLESNDRVKNKKIENQFLNFLNFIEKDCTTLILLGDIFDYWFEYKYTIPKYYYRTLAKLEQLTAKNINIIYVMGNHDFGHQTFFLEEMGIEIIKNDLFIELLGKNFFITHGDGKLPKDYGYRVLKKILRNKICQFLFSTIHPTIGIKLAIFSSKSSRKNRRKCKQINPNDLPLKDALIPFAEKIITQVPSCDFVVMGHTHKVSNVKIMRVDGTFGTYINPGSWLEQPHYAKFDGTNMELFKFD